MKLQNGDKIGTDEDPQSLADRFDASRSDGTLLKVDTDNDAVWINPHALLTIAPAAESIYEKR
ncbi:MAG TPA: hypothetical protein VNT54_03655 [Solirubrobacteraceae bacterium]|nr:hypothetical protein [Solirubrobacteraceae bacterium]